MPDKGGASMISKLFSLVSFSVLAIVVSGCGDFSPTAPSVPPLLMAPQTMTMRFGDTVTLTAEGGTGKYLFSLLGDSRYFFLDMEQVGPNQLRLRQVRRNSIRLDYPISARVHSGDQYVDARIILMYEE